MLKKVQHELFIYDHKYTYSYVQQQKIITIIILDIN